MVKLATAREARLYGPALAVRRWEYVNAGAYAFAALLLAAGLAALSAGGGASRAGLAVAAVALAAVAAVNAHDLAAHLAGVDWRVGLARYDAQLGLVEFLVPALHAAGCVLAVAGLALLVSQVHARAILSGIGHGDWSSVPSMNAGRTRRARARDTASGGRCTRRTCCSPRRCCGCWARCSTRARCTSAPTAGRSCCSRACRCPCSWGACSSWSPPS